MRTFFEEKFVEYCLFVLMVSEDKKKGRKIKKKNKKNLPRTKWILLRCDPQKKKRLKTKTLRMYAIVSDPLKLLSSGMLSFAVLGKMVTIVTGEWCDR